MINHRTRMMRKLNFVVLAFVATAFTACMKDTEPFDYEAQFEREKSIISEYVATNIPDATFQESTGIWFEVLAEGEPDSYQYKFVNKGNSLEAPIVRVKYKGVLLDGTQFDAVSDNEGMRMSLSGVIAAWQYSFFPKEIFNDTGELVEVGGLTPGGLKKGSKIRFVTPSLWAYREYGQGKVPANAPLDFTIEVLEIEAPTPQAY